MAAGTVSLVTDLDGCAAEAGRAVDDAADALRCGDSERLAAAVTAANAAAERATTLAKTAAGRRSAREMRALRRASRNARACRDVMSEMGR